MFPFLCGDFSPGAMGIPSFCLCLVLLGAVGVLHLLCMQSGYNRKRKFIYRYIVLYVDT